MSLAQHVAVVVAPSGELMSWTWAATSEGAILHFLPDIAQWPYARSQGYRLKFFEKRRGRLAKDDE